MRIDYRTAALAVCAIVVMAAPVAYAQVATTLEQAELAGLSPEKHAEVQARMGQGGQSVSEILPDHSAEQHQAQTPGKQNSGHGLQPRDRGRPTD